MKRSRKTGTDKVVTLNPHDRFFKEVFTRKEVAAEFFQLYLPTDLVNRLDLTSLTYLKDSFVTKELQEYYSDLLFKVSLKDGSPAYLYILLEHKSYAEKTTALQLLRYILSIWEMTLKKKQKGEALTFPVILPVVLYHGAESWGAGTALHDLVTYPASLMQFLPDFEFVLWDASRYRDEEIQGAVILQVALLLFRHIFRPDLRDQLPGILALLRELTQKQTGREYLETVIRYLLSAAPKDTVSDEDVKNAVEKAIPQIGGIIMVTIADTLIEKGMLQSTREDVVEILKIRFAKVPRRLTNNITRLNDLAILKDLHRKAAQADSIETFESFLKDMPNRISTTP